jgi:myo-inositol-1(or 4)-monophosphatase
MEARELEVFLGELVRRAGEILLRRWSDRHQIRTKVSYRDLVTEVDQQVETFLLDSIRRRFPGHAILAEESQSDGCGSMAAGSDAGSWRWIIDPLDGTTNYVHGFPFFCVSVALEHEGAVALGAVFDPVRHELFVAKRGQGAWLNGRRLSVSGTKEIGESLLITGFPYTQESALRNLCLFSKVLPCAQAVRRLGSAALDLCYVAAGRADGFWEPDLKPWDVAAGALMVEEAGGLVTDFSGRPFHLTAGELLATNGHIHRALISLLAG